MTGGSPLGFDVGAQGPGGTLKGLDLGVRGMRIGGRRKLLVPPNLAYGDKGVGEVPPGATLEFDVSTVCAAPTNQCVCVCGGVGGGGGKPPAWWQSMPAVGLRRGG